MCLTELDLNGDNVFPRSLLTIVICSLTFIGGAGARAQTWQWPVSSPEAQGLDGGVLAAFAAAAGSGAYGEIHSLLVIRHGYLDENRRKR